MDLHVGGAEFGGGGLLVDELIDAFYLIKMSVIQRTLHSNTINL